MKTDTLVMGVNVLFAFCHLSIHDHVGKGFLCPNDYSLYHEQVCHLRRTTVFALEYHRDFIMSDLSLALLQAANFWLVLLTLFFLKRLVY